jgi:hypothetical protein
MCAVLCATGGMFPLEARAGFRDGWSMGVYAGWKLVRLQLWKSRVASIAPVLFEPVDPQLIGTMIATCALCLLIPVRRKEQSRIIGKIGLCGRRKPGPGVAGCVALEAKVLVISSFSLLLDVSWCCCHGVRRWCLFVEECATLAHLRCLTTDGSSCLGCSNVLANNIIAGAHRFI